MNKTERKKLDKQYNRPDPGAVYSCMPTETAQGAYEPLWPADGVDYVIEAELSKRKPGSVAQLRFADPDGNVISVPVHINEHAYNLAQMGTVWRCDIIGDGTARIQPEVVKVGEWRTLHPFNVRLVDALKQEDKT